MRFYLQSALALVLLYLVTLTMPTEPAVTAVRASIVFGLALAAVKMILKHFNINWLSRRNSR